MKKRKFHFENPIIDKSYAFAIRIVNLYSYLTKEKKEFVISKQILRSGTSIAANLIEGSVGQSRKDFFAKFYIAYKELKETDYWIKLLCDTNLLSETQANSLLKDLEEISKILSKILLTTRKNLKKTTHYKH